MTLANVVLGLVIGLPMMIAFGPISVLLFDQGLERGVRPAAPAALGVACADLTFSVVASLAGASISVLLAPVERWLALAAVGILVAIALKLGRSSLDELRVRNGARSAAASVQERELTSAGGAGSGLSDDPVQSALDRSAPGHSQPVRTLNRAGGSDVHDAPFMRLSGNRLAATFYGLTMVNPVTIVLFASVVVAGTPGVGTAGWAVGMFLASLLAHGGFVVLGGVLGTALSPIATARLRLGSALFMACLALHFLLQA